MEAEKRVADSFFFCTDVPISIISGSPSTEAVKLCSFKKYILVGILCFHWREDRRELSGNKGEEEKCNIDLNQEHPKATRATQLVFTSNPLHPSWQKTWQKCQHLC